MNIKLAIGVAFFIYGNFSTANDKMELDKVTISENGNYLSSKNAYYKTRTQSATKTDTPNREIAQSVSVITNETLEDLNFVKLDDALDYVSGLSRQNNFGGLFDNYSVRGFQGNENTGLSTLKNGFSDNRGYNIPRDTVNIESIEFLKGPSGSLYGNSEPGGTLNVVTKQPNFDNKHHIKTDIGSYDFYRVSLDSTAPINESFAYRITAAAEKKSSFRDYVDSQRYIVAPSLIYSISDDTFLTYIGEFIEQKAPMDRGIALVNGQNIMNHKTFIGNPDDGDITLKNQTHQLKLDHYFSDNWSSKVGFAYKKNSLKGKATEIVPSRDITGNGDLLRVRNRDVSSDDIQFQAVIKGIQEIGDAKNTILFGIEAYRFEQDFIMYANNNAVRVDNILSKPTYTVLNSGLGSKTTDRNEKSKGVALFIQDELAYKDFRFLAGLRYDEVIMDNLNYLNK